MPETALFPIFVMTKDSGDVIRFSTLQMVRSELEQIDIENEEYLVWDSAGRPLRFTVGAGGLAVVDEPNSEAAPALAQVLRAILEVLDPQPIISPTADLVALYSQLEAAYEEQHPRSRFGARYPLWLPTKRG
jgi:hypothetical protein